MARHIIFEEEYEYKKLKYKIKVTTTDGDELKISLKIVEAKGINWVFDHFNVEKIDLDKSFISRLFDEYHENTLEGGLESFDLESYIDDIRKNVENLMDKAIEKMDSDTEKVLLKVEPFRYENDFSLKDSLNKGERVELKPVEYRGFKCDGDLRIRDERCRVSYKVSSPDYIEFRNHSFYMDKLERKEEMLEKAHVKMKEKIDNVLLKHEEYRKNI